MAVRREHLVWAVVGLVLGAIVFNIATREGSAPPPSAPAAAAPVDTPRQFGGAPRRAPAPTPAGGGDSSFAYLEELARAQRRQAIRAAVGSTYLNEMYAGSDSMVHRWVDRAGRRPVRVILTPPAEPVTGYDPAFLDAVRKAFEAWQDVGLPVLFAFPTDSAGADVRLAWRQKFDTDRTGLTDIQWDRNGAHLAAVITLSTQDSAGEQLSERQVRVVTLHEIGHVLGLLHSDDPNDLMFPATRAETFSDRDLRSLRVLYSLSPGSFKR